MLNKVIKENELIKAQAKAETVAYKAKADKFETGTNEIYSENADKNNELILKDIIKSNEFTTFMNLNKEKPVISDGGKDDHIKYLGDLIKYIKHNYNLLKTDVYIKLVSLFKYQDKFTILYTNINKSSYTVNEYIELFFVNLENYPNIKNILIKDYTESNILKRDSLIYKLYNKEAKSNSYIFNYKLVSILSDISQTTDFTNLFQNKNNSSELTQLLHYIIININNIMSNHENLNSQINTISSVYKEVFNSNKKLFTIVKSRCDTHSINPRYDIETYNDNNDNYLFLRYFNNDSMLDNDTKINYNEHYFYGPFDKVYMNSKEKNQKIATDMLNMLKDKIITKDENLLTFTYGQSGAGKTSSFIYLKNKKDPTKSEDGILIHLCNSESFKNKFSKIKVKIVNVYIWHGSKNIGMDNIQEQDYNVSKINIDNDDSYSFIFDKKLSKWVYEKDIGKETVRDLGFFIDYGLNLRQVESTPNNPNSSRSHVIIMLSFDKSDKTESKQTLAIMDLAGDENVFLCNDSDNKIDNFKEIIKYDTNYKLSDKYNNEPIQYDKYACVQDDTKITHLSNIKYYKNENCNKSDTCKYNTLFFTDGVDSEEKYRIILGKIIEEEQYKEDIYNEFKNIVSEITKDTNYNKFIEENYHKSFISKIKNFENIYNKPYIEKINNLIKEQNKTLTEDKKITYYLFKLFDDYFGKQYTTKDLRLIPILEKPNGFKNIEQVTRANEKIPDEEIKKYSNERFVKLVDYFNNIIKNEELEKLKDINFLKENKIIDVKSDPEKIEKAKCSLIRLDKIIYNCKLRKSEGYMINKSLKDLREDIKSIIRNSVSEEPLPIFYDKDMFPYCRNAYLEDEPYDKFYNPVRYDNKSSGILTKTLQKYGMDLMNVNFLIFTVINLTNNGIVNNPPNPPYINISNLNYYWNNNSNVDESIILNEVNNLKGRMKNYNFYKTEKLISDNIDITNYKSIIPELLKLIKNNNPATLIGSLDSTQLSQYTSYDNYCSYSVDLNKKINNFNITINKNLNINNTEIIKKLEKVLPLELFSKNADGKKTKRKPRKKRSPKLKK